MLAGEWGNHCKGYVWKVFVDQAVETLEEGFNGSEMCAWEKREKRNASGIKRKTKSL
ncbi:hypothetical protein MPNT_40164 [Candidatus Methylacidithermus pantelleriae]|uniref:Uncharacterized protein n=1 Tax=Candidatus Methylacidithermus pantelleriae TaxID=2744239 RepID=A0A8J2BNB8_9BACT|nr:hypothetical protein MPNT_40164 [Candidatus Methylacidithermus pantelleriae]